MAAATSRIEVWPAHLGISHLDLTRISEPTIVIILAIMMVTIIIVVGIAIVLVLGILIVPANIDAFVAASSATIEIANVTTNAGRSVSCQD